MEHFHLVASGVDPVPLLLALKQQPHLWNQFPFRTQSPQSPHREAQDIIVRAQVPGGADGRECVWYPAWPGLPPLRGMVFGLLTQVQGVRLGRVLITRLDPGGQISPHRDYGPAADGYADTEPYWQRFHWCLQADEGSLFGAGEEVVRMHPGDVWWFDGGQRHWVQNTGQVPRLHVIVDVHSSEEVADGALLSG